MYTTTSTKYAINLSFNEIRLSLFQDILVLGKNCPQGKIGIFKSFELLVPNGFEIVEINNEVEAIFISKRILSKISKEKIIDVLRSLFELLQVDFKVTLSCSIESEI